MQETQEVTLSQLIERDRITITNKYVDRESEQQRGPDGKRIEWESDRWKSTLHLDGRRMTVDFRMGIGHHGKEPDVKTVMSSVISDALAGSESFEDFCSEFGYDEDSRTAERIWKACQRTEKKLRQFLAGSYDEYTEAQNDI